MQLSNCWLLGLLVTCAVPVLALLQASQLHVPTVKHVQKQKQYSLFKSLNITYLIGGAVAQLVERWTCDQQVVGSIPTRGKAV